MLTADGAGGVQYTSLAASALPATAALLDRSDQIFTGQNRFPSLQIFTDNGSTRAAPIGELNRDNIAIAWARITAAGGLDSNYNIASVTRVAAGRYSLTLAVSASSGFSLVPLVTPEVDPDGSGIPPTGTANLRLAVTNQVAAGKTFDVYMYNGQGTLVDNDFQLLVFGR